MKTFLNIIFCTIILVGYSSCQKKIDSFVPDNFQGTADTVWQSNLNSNASVFSLKNDLKVAKITDSFSYTNTGIILSSGNISLSIPVNSLIKNNGLMPSGNVQSETLLSLKRGDYIAMGMPTTCNDRLLISGGAFFLNLKNNGDNLAIAQGNKLTIKFNATNPFPYNRIFNPSPDSSNGFNWVVNNDTTFNKSSVTNTGYEIQTNRLQHVQTAHFIDTAGIAQTTLSVKLPSNYTNSNTICYVSFNTMECVAGLKANIGLRSFVSPLLPLNKPITIVVISKQAGDYYLGILQTNTSLPTSTPSTAVLITPVKKTLEYIKNYLNTL